MKKMKVSLILNIILVFLVTLISIFMFTGFRFMPDETLLEANRIEMFKFFTVDSNLLIGLSSLIYLSFIVKLLNNKLNIIPKWVYVFKLMAVSGITLTFITTAFFLVPQFGLYAMYNNNNLFFHLIIPVISLISFIFYEKYNYTYKNALWGIGPMFIYSIYYLFNILLHLNNGGLTFKYDYYGFLQGNINNIYIVIPLVYLITYLLSLLLVFLNRKTK